MKASSPLAALALVSALVAPASAARAEDRLMPVDGAELAYTERGEGRPVVFVHGALSDARVWAPYADAISAGGRFVAYTQRYFGPRDWPDDGAAFSRETHIADLIAVVEGLDAGPVDLVSWSYGGEIATYAALRRPDLFRTLVHFEPAVAALMPALPGAEAAGARFRETLGPAVGALRAGNLEDAALRFIEAVFRMETGTAGDEPAPFPSYWRQNGRTLPAFVRMAPGAPIACADLGKLRVPTLIVVGTETLVRYAMMAEALADCSGNAFLAPMDGVTHDGPYRDPEGFAGMITAFHDLVDMESAARAGGGE